MTTATTQAGTPPEFTRGDRYRRARLNAGNRSVQRFADDIGVSRNVIAGVESDRHEPRAIVTKMWAIACGVPEWWLKGETPPPAGGDGAKCAIRDSNPEPAD